jgi:polyferredoxin
MKERTWQRWLERLRSLGRDKRGSHERPRKTVLLLTVLVVVVYLLHQDVWNWKRIEPLVMGFLPIGLAYHAGFSVLAAVTMAVLVRFAWPKHLEEAPPAERQNPKDEA